MIRGSVVVGYLDGGKWSACFGLSYRDLCLFDVMASQRIVRKGGKELRNLCGSGGIVAGRNKVAEDFVDHTDGEWLWFIDTDMGFASNTVDQLVASADPTTRPVMGALCFQLKRQPQGPLYAERTFMAPTLYEYLELESELGFRPIRDYERDRVVRVAGTGAACLLIHRSALVTLRAKYGGAWFEPLTHPAGDNGKPRTFSEDLAFCIRLQACDIPVHVDTRVKTTHEKGALFLDEEMYDRQRTRELAEVS